MNWILMSCYMASAGLDACVRDALRAGSTRTPWGETVQVSAVYCVRDDYRKMARK